MFFVKRITIMMLRMYQVFSSLQGHLHFFVHFIFTFMENLFHGSPDIYVYELNALISYSFNPYCIISIKLVHPRLKSEELKERSTTFPCFKFDSKPRRNELRWFGSPSPLYKLLHIFRCVLASL